MPIARPFAYNPSQTSIAGATQSGNLAIATQTLDWNSTGLSWWMGPDEENTYIVAAPYPAGDFPTPIGNVGTVSFWSSPQTDAGLAALATQLIGGSYASASAASAALFTAGYWTSYTESSIVQDNLLVWLDASNSSSYPGSGTSWLNLASGGGYTGTISGATWSSTDSGIFDFDGNNDQVSIAHTSSLSLSTSQPRTVQVWVKFDALPSSGAQMPVFGKLSSSFSFDGYWGGLFSNAGVVRCVTNGASQQRITDSVLTVTTNTWYLFTFISQITNTAGSTKVYINETEYSSAAHGTDSYSESNPFYLGFIGSGVGSLYLNGKIGALYFYTAGLSTSNISTNFNATKTRYGL